ncbi:hypothetical protein AeMF1_013280, partial [Aphanomyces euteiches]
VFEAIEKWVFRTVDDQIERATSLEIKAEWLNRKASLIVTNGQIDVGALISQQCYDLYCQEGDKYDKLPAKWDTLSQLAIIKMYQGRPLDEVEPMFLEALNHQIELLTKNHVDTLATMNYLGTCYLNHRKYDIALPIFMECFELRVQLLGEGDSWTRETMGNISSALRLQDNVEEALKWSTRCYDIECRLIGDGSFRTRNEMGLGYLALGDFVRAKEQLEAVCQECRRMFGLTNHQTIITDSNLALVYRQQGMYSDAEKILLRCLEYGSAWVRTKEYCCRWLGMVYLGTQEYSRATDSFNEALSLLKTQGWNSEKLLPYLPALFTLKMKTGEFEHLDKIDAFENASWTQDVWKTCICHGCHAEIHGMLYACPECPPLSLQFCRACAGVEKHKRLCKHNPDLLKSHKPPLRYLQEERLKILEKNLQWSGYEPYFLKYEVYCDENQVPIDERLTKTLLTTET